MSLYHFSPKLKSFASESMWFQFYCHFGSKVKLCHISQIKSYYFVVFPKGKIVIIQKIYIIYKDEIPLCISLNTPLFLSLLSLSHTLTPPHHHFTTTIPTGELIPV
ncbi:hypothetical protein Hanom_Chr02g00151511 [Helianthus anomalus]